jgi:hypothetical protein
MQLTTGLGLIVRRDICVELFTTRISQQCRQGTFGVAADVADRYHTVNASGYGKNARDDNA